MNNSTYFPTLLSHRKLHRSQNLRQMNPLATTFRPKQHKLYHLNADQLTENEEKIFQEILYEWTHTTTRDLLLQNWTERQRRNLSMLNVDEKISLLLLNISSLKRYLIEFFNLMDEMSPPIIILNGTHHDEDAIKKCAAHLYTYNVFAAKGTNIFGGVLVAVHKSIHSRRITDFEHIPNLLLLELGSDSSKFQLLTCYSPPTECIPLDIFERVLQRNPKSIITGDLNAKHSSWSRSAHNQKGRILSNWLDTLPQHQSLEIVNKHERTSTRSNATIDLIMAPQQMGAGTFSVLPHIGNDHYPILWHPTFKIPSRHRRHPIKRTYWKLFQCFLTFTGSYWQALATNMNYTADFFTLYERFLTLTLSRLTTVTLRASMKPSLPQTLVEMIKQKRQYLKLFRQTRHPYFAVALRDMTKLLQKQLYLFKRDAWSKYCKSFNECDTKAFWAKAKRHFGRKAAPIEGFLNNGNTITKPEEMCLMSKEYYE